MKWLYVLLLGAFFWPSCSYLKNKEERKPLARAFDKYLYPEDVEDLVSEDMTPEDSARIVSQYLDQWVKTQLLVKKAELNLTDEQKDLEKELEDYRSALLIDRYLQKFTQQKLDTTITLEEVEHYYEEHTQDFKLASNVVRAVYLQLPIDAPDLEQVHMWMKSDEKQDMLNLEDYCYTNAIKFKNYNNEWIGFSTLQRDLPISIENPTDFLANRKLIESRDSMNLYVAYIKEHRIEGEQTPLDFVKDNIRKVLLTKRKTDLIRELKNNIFTDGYSHEYFEIYEPQKAEEN